MYMNESTAVALVTAIALTYVIFLPFVAGFFLMLPTAWVISKVVKLK